MGTWPLHLKGSYITSCIIIKGVIEEKCSISKESLSKTEKAKPCMPKIPSSLLDCDIFFPEVRIRKETEIGLASTKAREYFCVGHQYNMMKEVRSPAKCRSSA